VQFRQKIEAAVLPLLNELLAEIAKLRTTDVLNHYQFRLNLSQLDKDKLPDGFWAKGRYVSALALASAFQDNPSAEAGATLARIDDLVERIYDTYSFGAVYDPGKLPGSEKEFLTRLGLGIRVREPDALGFPEQFRTWAVARLQPFNERYFVPTFGLTFEEISKWLHNLSDDLEKRLNDLVEGLRPIAEDMEAIREQFVSGTLGLEAARERSQQLKLPERLDANAREGDAAHILSFEEIKRGIPEASAKELLATFGIHPGEVTADFKFPHDPNPLDRKLFVNLPDGGFYFLDPASADRIMARVFERAILDDEKLRQRFLRNRDRSTERLVFEAATALFPGAGIYPNYYLQKGSHEKDLMIVYGKALVIVECKNTRVRAFSGATDDLLKFENDFENAVQYGYDQALEVKDRILAGEEATFYHEDGKEYFSVRKAEIDRIFVVCITPTTRGPLGTNLSYELEKREDEPFPLSLGLFDFQTICTHFKADQFIEYLKEREKLHGVATTGDELNFAGYFLKFGHLNLQKGEFLTDDFSSFFDRKWYRERGIDLEEPPDKPVSTSMQRKGNRIYVEHSGGKKEVIRLPDWAVARTVGKSPIRMRGSDRNKPCPCGSGLKLKRCCGVA
jgi:SEC-C motif